MKKRLLSLALTIVMLTILIPTAIPATTAAAFTPITGWDMMEKLGAGITFANSTEARPWPWNEDWKLGDLIAEGELCWGQPKIEEWHFKSVAMKGFDSYRLCVSWIPYMDKDYKINPAWLDRIQQIVDWAQDAGLNVLLNSHHDEELYEMIRDIVFRNGDYNEAKKLLTTLWSQVATRFKDYPETLIFEIMNEPNLLKHYGSDEGEWVTENGQVSQKLCDTVNKLNKDALEIIRKSGGNNDKRVVMLCVPGAATMALPFMEVPDNDPYIMLGTFGYDDEQHFISENTIHHVKAWLDKGIGFINKEDSYTKSLEHTKKHYEMIAGLGIPSFYFTGGTASHEEGQFIDRTTGAWVNKPLIDAFFAAYGKKPGPDFAYVPPPPDFPYEVKESIKPDEPTWFTIPDKELKAAEKLIVEINEKLGWFQIETMTTDGWQGFHSGHSRVTEDAGKILFDMRNLNVSGIGFRPGNGDETKIKRIYIDTWEGTAPAEAPSLDSASPWARPHIENALAKGFIPTDIQNNYQNTITRSEFCRMAVKWVEYALGKNIAEIVAERGIPERMNRTFSDTTDASILAAYRLGITAGSTAPDEGKPGLFNPNGQFTRQEAAVMIMNTCKAIGADVSGSPTADFTDINAPETAGWARPGINFVRANGIMSGSDGKFNPAFTYTRQESIITFNNIKHNELPGR